MENTDNISQMTFKSIQNIEQNNSDHMAYLNAFDILTEKNNLPENIV